MSAIEPLCHLMGVSPHKLTKEENLLVETALFENICRELREIFRDQYKEYFRLMKFTTQKEDQMLEANLVRLITMDILSTDEYNIQGIASYTNMPEDVVQEVCASYEYNPSATFFRRIIELHRIVRRDLYHSIMKKIIADYLPAA